MREAQELRKVLEEDLKAGKDLTSELKEAFKKADKMLKQFELKRVQLDKALVRYFCGLRAILIDQNKCWSDRSCSRDLHNELGNEFHCLFNVNFMQLSNYNSYFVNVQSEKEGITYDPEIERTLHRCLRASKQGRAESAEMAEQRTMMDYAKPTLTGAASSIVRPAIVANNFKIKLAIIQMFQNTVQFCGLAHEDPNTHIANFLEICDTFKHNGVSDDVVRLRLFPFSLKDKVKTWLSSLPARSISTWDEMASRFLSKYFPPSKIAKMRNDITTFSQQDGESLYESWERYKELLRKVPHHGLPVWLQVQTFYNELTEANKTIMDATAGGSINNKTPEVAHALIEEMTANNYQWHSERAQVRRQPELHNVDTYTTLSAQIDALSKKIYEMQLAGTHVQTVACEWCGGGHISTECQVRNQFMQSPKQVDFVGNLQRQQGNQYPRAFNPGWRNHPNLSWQNQNAVKPFPQNFNQPENKSNLEELMTKFIASAETRFQNQEASIKNLETQVGQLAQMISSRVQGALPSNTEANPREQVQAITLRSGKELQEVEKKAKEEDALAQMPHYTKFLKEILANKGKLGDVATVAMNEECSPILLNKLPQKLKDPGSFTIPCTIGSLKINKALCDLGANINLMSYSVFKKLGLGEPQPTRVALQLPDRSIKHPRGIIEDVLVKVDKFIFPVDFIVLDMEEDVDVPLILGRPFLATGKATVDVQQGQLSLKIQDEEVIFKMSDAMKHAPSSDDSCYMIDVIDYAVGGCFQVNGQRLKPYVADGALPTPSTVYLDVH
ncbi:PREDICTED: uncharacterized protein LOC104590568 [Nelumbo nucifera]|uniref:Uncharacterized protein LOC104590568 n=1 Tax=Nelumbo nucifera TaxID=4432 RepID=A0A1U7Z951_NELNU|nr:PREDICTED: uncharacterized protein LOC104590568 [Nelumbo nucifera]